MHNIYLDHYQACKNQEKMCYISQNWNNGLFEVTISSKIGVRGFHSQVILFYARKMNVAHQMTCQLHLVVYS